MVLFDPECMVLFPPGPADTDGPPVTVVLVVTGHRRLCPDYGIVGVEHHKQPEC